MQERRRFIRVQTPVLVEFPNPETMKTERSFTSDVSESGMRFPTTVKLQVGDEIPVALELPFAETTMHATGEVQWVRETARQGEPHYEIGIRFKWIEDPDRQKLSRHLGTIFPGRSR
jgi:Tfp pilus assembly protein PilZ